MSYLNQPLYDSLSKRFGEVTVRNRGEKPIVLGETKKANRVGVLGHRDIKVARALARVTGGEFYSVNCPYCGDQRSRLWISCAWNTEINGERVRHLAICYNEGCNLFKLIDELKPYISKNKRPVVIETKKKTTTDEIVEYPYPEGCVSLCTLPKSHSAVKYLDSRGFTPEDVDVYGVTYCDVNTSRWGAYLENRLVFPFYLDGKLVGYQTRVIDKNDRSSKYWLLPGSKKTMTFFGLGVFDNVKDIYLVEGVFDAISAGPGGFAIFGKTISDDQITLLKRYYPKNNIYVVLDEDAYDNGLRIKEILTERGCLNKIKAIKLPDDADPGSMSREHLMECIYRK